MSNISFNVQSNIGGRAENQDCYASKQTNAGLLIVVCDGMGGTAGGKTAAEMACRLVTEQFSRLTDNIVEGITRAIQSANQAIYAKGRSEASLLGMGTTIAALLLSKGKAAFFHAGDSRIYQLRAGRIEKRTADHSRVGEMVRRGILSDEQARLSAESNIISKALGIEPELEPEVEPDIPYVKGDRFVICTDGVWGTLPEHELLEAWSENKPVEAIAQPLIDRINRTQQSAGGGHDNMTLALAEIMSGGSSSSKLSMPVLLNFILTIALAGSLVYIFTRHKSEPPVKDPAPKKDTAVHATPPQSPVPKDTSKVLPAAGSQPSVTPPVPKTYTIDEQQLTQLKELFKKLQAAAQKDTTGKIKPLINELGKEIAAIK